MLFSCDLTTPVYGYACAYVVAVVISDALLCTVTDAKPCGPRPVELPRSEWYWYVVSAVLPVPDPSSAVMLFTTFSGAERYVVPSSRGSVSAYVSRFADDWVIVTYVSVRRIAPQQGS